MLKRRSRRSRSSDPPRGSLARSGWSQSALLEHFEADTHLLEAVNQHVPHRLGADGFYGPAIVAGQAAVRLLAEEFLATPLKLILLAPTHAYVQNRAAGFPPAPESPDIDDLQAMLDWPICRELERFYDVLCDPQSRDPQLLELVSRALARGKVATGHGVERGSPAQLAAWAAAGITNDHEGIDATAVERRLEAGLHVLLRHEPGLRTCRRRPVASCRGRIRWMRSPSM